MTNDITVKKSKLERMSWVVALKISKEEGNKDIANFLHSWYGKKRWESDFVKKLVSTCDINDVMVMIMSAENISVSPAARKQFLLSLIDLGITG